MQDAAQVFVPDELWQLALQRVLDLAAALAQLRLDEGQAEGAVDVLLPGGRRALREDGGGLPKRTGRRRRAEGQASAVPTASGGAAPTDDAAAAQPEAGGSDATAPTSGSTEDQEPTTD
jgi:hypothetical protein